MFFEMLLDLRLNIMDKYVDKFVITEASYMHSGKPKKLLFDINKFSKFKDKIIYIIVNDPPPRLLEISDLDKSDVRDLKKIQNAYKREIYQIEKTQDGLVDANPDDIIIISDLDEIPNLENIDFSYFKKNLVFFKQKMFYYKFNLLHESLPWYGSKACQKKYFKSPQWLRSIKNKQYPIWRLDILFSNKKYNNISFIKDGGWHFTNMRKAEDLNNKLSNFLHHVDFETSGLKTSDLEKLIRQKKVMYNHTIDKKGFKWSEGEILKKIDTKILPKYIIKNIDKYKQWIEK